MIKSIYEISKHCHQPQAWTLAGAGVALIYGFGQLGSWLYNGKTLEENVGKSVGW